MNMKRMVSTLLCLGSIALAIPSTAAVYTQVNNGHVCRPVVATTGVVLLWKATGLVNTSSWQDIWVTCPYDLQVNSLTLALPGASVLVVMNNLNAGSVNTTCVLREVSSLGLIVDQGSVSLTIPGNQSGYVGFEPFLLHDATNSLTSSCLLPHNSQLESFIQIGNPN